MNFTYCRQVYMAYKKEKSKRKLPKLFFVVEFVVVVIVLDVVNVGAVLCRLFVFVVVVVVVGCSCCC